MRRVRTEYTPREARAASRNKYAKNIPCRSRQDGIRRGREAVWVLLCASVYPEYDVLPYDYLSRGQSSQGWESSMVTST